MSTTKIKAWEEENGETHLMVDGEEVPLEESLTVVNHSPTGFAWGYGGSGPAQTALAIMLRFFHGKGASWEDARKLAGAYHQYFKQDWVARWDWNAPVDTEINVDSWAISIRNDYPQQIIAACGYFK